MDSKKNETLAEKRARKRDEALVRNARYQGLSFEEKMESLRRRVNRPGVMNRYRWECRCGARGRHLSESRRVVRSLGMEHIIRTLRDGRTHGMRTVEVS